MSVSYGEKTREHQMSLSSVADTRLPVDTCLSVTRSQHDVVSARLNHRYVLLMRPEL